MKLIWHIVWKDVTRLRWWLVLWVVALALPILDGVEVLASNPFPLPDGVWTRPTMHGWLVFAQTLVALLSTVLVFQEDRVTGTRQFWTTRPIAGGRMLLGKVIAAVAIEWLIPVCVTLPWWWWCGFDGTEMMLGAIELGLIATVVTVPIAAVSCVTDSLARTLVWSAVVAITMVPLFLITMQSTRSMLQLGSRAVVIVAMLLVEMALLCALRFVWRRQWWPLVCVIGLMVASVWYGRSLPWVLFDTPGEWHPERASQVQLRFRRMTYASILRTKPEYLQPVDCEFFVEGSSRPPVVLNVSQTWQTASGLAISRPGVTRWDSDSAPYPLAGLHPIAPDPETIRSYSARRVARGFPPIPVPSDALGQPVVNVHTILPASLGTALRSEHTHYTANALLSSVSFELADEIALEPGHWKANANCGIRIDRVTRRDGGAALEFVTARPAPLWDVFVRPGWRGWIQYALSSGFILINRARHEYVPISHAQKVVSMNVAGVNITWQTAVSGASPVIRNGKLVRRPEWLEGATLGMMSIRPDSIFARTISVPDVTIEDATKASSSLPNPMGLTHSQ